MHMLWNLTQDRKIVEARLAASNTASTVSDVAKYVVHLEERLDKLGLICRAMWSFLQEATQLSEEALMDRVKEVDLTDGKLDGKVTKPAVQCPNCGKVMSPRHHRCIWCGEDRPGATAFDQV